MNPDQLADILNRLLEAETASLTAHLGELSPYAGPGSAAVKQLADRVCGERLAAIDWLCERVATAGRTPRQALPSSELSAMHYLSYDYLLPRVIRDLKGVQAVYGRTIPLAQGDLDLHNELQKLADSIAVQLSELEAMARQIDAAQAAAQAAPAAADSTATSKPASS